MAFCVIVAVDVAFWVSPEAVEMLSKTTALLFALELVWMIVHFCVRPPVFMQTAVLVAVTVGAAT